MEIVVGIMIFMGLVGIMWVLEDIRLELRKINDARDEERELEQARILRGAGVK